MREKHYYTAESLRRELDAFKERFGMSSERHYELRYTTLGGGCYATDGVIPHFESHVWAHDV